MVNPKNAKVLEAEAKQAEIDAKQLAWNDHRYFQQLKARHEYRVYTIESTQQLKKLQNAWDAECKALTLHVSKHLKTGKGALVDNPLVVAAQARILKACVEMLNYEATSGQETQRLWQGVMDSDKIPFTPPK